MVLTVNLTQPWLYFPPPNWTQLPLIFIILLLHLAHCIFYYDHILCILSSAVITSPVITSYFLSPTIKNSNVISLHGNHFLNIVTTVCQPYFFSIPCTTLFSPKKHHRLAIRNYFISSDFLTVLFFSCTLFGLRTGISNRSIFNQYVTVTGGIHSNFYQYRTVTGGI